MGVVDTEPVADAAERSPGREGREAPATRDEGMFTALGWQPVDFDAFHRVELPRRLDGGLGDRVAWDVAGRPPFALRAPDGAAYSYIEDRGRVRIEPGVCADAALVVDIGRAAWQDYVYELRTRHGLLHSRSVTLRRGRFADWDAWEPAIRCLYSGTPVYRPSALGLRDLADRPLRLGRAFTPAGDPEEMAHFLRTTGYLVVRGALGRDDVETLRAELERLRAQTREGDPGSSWETGPTGRRFAHRLAYLGLRSPRIAALSDDPMVRRLCALADPDLVAVTDRDLGHFAVLCEAGGRPAARTTPGPPGDPGVPGDPGDPGASWHRDCGLGGCPVTCPRVHVGIHLDAMDEPGSRLHMLAGSWGTTAHEHYRPGEWEALPVVGLDAEPGDVTVHMGCGLHTAPAATGTARRRSLYLQFANPRLFDVIRRFGTYGQMITGSGGGRVPGRVRSRQRPR